MKDVTIPLVDFLEEQIAEVEVKINGKKRKYNFRIESFPWGTSDEDITNKINRLKENIESYGNEWELVQIFSPAEGAKHIQVLFKQKTTT